MSEATKQPDGTAATHGSAHAIEMRKITKRFGAVTANDELDLLLQPGEIHALLGENGAGKTTLMRVLYGVLRPDSGEIIVNNQAVAFRSPHDALAHGIGMIPQHSDLVEKLTVAENIVLGSRSHWKGRLKESDIVAEVRQTAEQAGMTVDPRARVSDLSVDAQQQVEILKLLHRGALTLILDEPTAVLGPTQIDGLFDTLRRLAAEDHAIVIITHKLNEVMAVADRVTVIRHGRAVVTAGQGGFDEQTLAHEMVGHEVADVSRKPRNRGLTDEVLRVEGISVHGDRGAEAVKQVSLVVTSGEIVGVAGVEGNGQIELAEALSGLRRPSSGTVLLDGLDITGHTSRNLHAVGVSMITEDRTRWDVVGELTLTENLAMARIASGEFVRTGVLRTRMMNQEAVTILKEYDVRPADPDIKARALSGGNQQKLVLARELSRNPRLLIASQPTRGLDVDATSFVHNRLLALREKGGAILLTSLDLEELLSLSDRIIVLYRGQIALQGSTESLTVSNIAQAMAGATTQALPVQSSDLSQLAT